MSISTVFGRARINSDGYYAVTSVKEGNNKKLLHRLIWQKWYGEIPSTTVIHHIDGNKLNNCIWNLEPMSISEHNNVHNQVIEYKQRLSEAKKGLKHPKAIYDLWDNEKVHYNNSMMFQRNRESNPCRCFALKYGSKDVNIGRFIDFVSPQIISDIIGKEG